MERQELEGPTLCADARAFVVMIMQVKQKSSSLEPWAHNFF